MCLEVTVEFVGAPAEDAKALAAALDGSTALTVRTTRRRSWLKEGPAIVAISEDGGCGCSLLDDEAEFDAHHWVLRSDVRPALAEIVERIPQHYCGDVRFFATFGGDKPTHDADISPAELAQIILSDTLGTTTAYCLRGHAV